MSVRSENKVPALIVVPVISDPLILPEAVICPCALIWFATYKPDEWVPLILGVLIVPIPYKLLPVISLLELILPEAVTFPTKLVGISVLPK